MNFSKLRLTGSLTVALLIAAFPAAPAMAVPGDNNCELTGAGTVASPYLVGTRTDLEEISDCDNQAVTRYFRQTANIDLVTAWTPITLFAGSYDGGSFTIANLLINEPTSVNPVGLFRSGQRFATLQNLTITVSSVTGLGGVGALAGSWEGSDITNVTVLPANQNHVFQRTVQSYSVTSNVVTLNLGVNHGLVIGSQIKTGDAALGPLTARSIFAISSVNAGAGTASISFATANLASTVPPAATTVQVTNPLVRGKNDVGGVLGRATGYFTQSSGLSGEVHLNGMVKMLSVTSQVPVAGEVAVGGVVGLAQRVRFTLSGFTGTVTGIAAADDGSVGGFVGRSYDSGFASVNVVAEVAGVAEQTGGILGMVDDSGDKPFCALSPATRFTSVSAPVANTVEFLFPENTAHAFTISETVGLAVRSTGISNGVRGVVSAITALAGQPVKIAVTATTATFGTSNFHPLSFLVPIRDVDSFCRAQVFDVSFSGIVSGGKDGAGESRTGGIAGSFSRSAMRIAWVVSANVTGTGNWVGGAIGDSQGSSLERVNVSVSGGAVRGVNRVGGVVGYATGHLQSAFGNPSRPVSALEVFSSNVTVSGASRVGGLFGEIVSLQVNYSISNAVVEGTSFVGGLFGQAGNSMTVMNSEYRGSRVHASAGDSGGVAGMLTGTEAAISLTQKTRIDASTVEFQTVRNHLLAPGDRVWIKFAGDSVSRVVSVQTIVDATRFQVDIPTTPSSAIAVGDEMVKFNALAVVTVSSGLTPPSAAAIRADGSRVGGLVGSASSSVIENSSNSLQIKVGLGVGDSADDIGGLVGSISNSAFGPSHILNSFSTATISADAPFQNIQNVGGLVGSTSNILISDSFFRGDILFPASQAGTSVQNLGGLVGNSFQSRIDSSFAQARLEVATTSANIGGLTGQAFMGSLGAGTMGIAQSFFDGVVSVPQGSRVGGISGMTDGALEYVHATADIVGTDTVGGLIGQPVSNPDILYSYFDGTVTRPTPVTISEVIGANTYTGDILFAYWNSTAQSSALTTGARTAAQLATASTFSSWNLFANFYQMPSASLTTKPFPTITKLVHTPLALQVLAPATDLNGILQGTDIVPITTAAIGYPRPVLAVVGTLPSGLAASGFTVSGAPTSGGAYSFDLAARNTVGTGPTTAFAGNVASLTQPAYAGPMLTGPFPIRMVAGQTVTLNGSQLAGVTAIAIDGVRQNAASATGTSITFVVPVVGTGLKDLTLFSGEGAITVQQAVLVTLTLAAKAKITNRDGRVRLFHPALLGAGKVQFFHNGKEVAWSRFTEAQEQVQSSNYLVRTRALLPGKNVFEIHVDGKRVKRVSHRG